MINRFRIEGEAKKKDALIDELSLSALRVISALNNKNGEWECTDDVVTKSDGGYKGRMVLKFHRAQA